MRELTLQKRLGHASPESLRIYTRVSDPEVVADYNRALGQGESGPGAGGTGERRSRVGRRPCSDRATPACAPTPPLPGPNTSIICAVRACTRSI